MVMSQEVMRKLQQCSDRKGEENCLPRESFLHPLQKRWTLKENAAYINHRSHNAIKAQLFFTKVSLVGQQFHSFLSFH